MFGNRQLSSITCISASSELFRHRFIESKKERGIINDLIAIWANEYFYIVLEIGKCIKNWKIIFLVFEWNNEHKKG